MIKSSSKKYFLGRSSLPAKFPGRLRPPILGIEPKSRAPSEFDTELMCKYRVTSQDATNVVGIRRFQEL